MSAAEKFIPLPEANTSRIRTVVELPFGVEERIGIRLSAVNWLLQLGGINHLRIETKNGETSKPNMMIVGVNAQGGAYGGAAKSETVPSYNTDLDVVTGGSLMHSQAIWHNLSLTLNKDEMQQRILDAKGDVRSAQKWAGELNQAITRGIVLAGVDNSLFRLNKYTVLLGGFLWTMDVTQAAGIMMTKWDPHVPQLGELLTELMFSGVLFSLIDRMRWGGEKPGVGRRFSLFFGVSPDRAALLWGLSRVWQPLVKPLEK